MKPLFIPVRAFAYALLFIFSFFLLFDRLDARLLWGDEAETALLSKQVIRLGLPKTTDGVNHITVLGGGHDETSSHIWTWAPWLQEYLVAATYAALPPTTWSSRAPFAAIAFLSVVFLAWVAFRIYQDHCVAFSCAALLATSEVFLLHSRQCRYYAITVFAEILLVLGCFNLWHDRKRGVWLTSLALVLQFYSNYIVLAANIPLLFALGGLVYLKKRSVIPLLAVAAILSVAAFPWLCFAHPWQQTAAFAHEPFVSKLGYYVSEWHFHFLPLLFLLLPLLRFVRPDSDRSRDDLDGTRVFDWVLFAGFAGYLFVLAVPPAELRYLLPLLPLGLVLGVSWLFRYVRSAWLAFALVALQATTNIVAIAPTFGLAREHTWRAPLFAFINGLQTRYEDRFSDVLDFFTGHSQPGQSVWVADPEFPLIFYTGVKIIDARFETPRAFPDWILPESASGISSASPLEIPASVGQYYDRIVLRVHDSDRLASVPEPDVYKYRTTSEVGDFVVLRKRPQD